MGPVNSGNRTGRIRDRTLSECPWGEGVGSPVHVEQYDPLANWQTQQRTARTLHHVIC
jgi:hypothetical protein